MLHPPRLAQAAASLLLAAVSLGTARAQYQGDTATVQQKPFHWPEGKRAALSLTFDDGRPSQLEAGVPILNRHGVRATFYVNPRPISARVEDWKKVSAAGHEIGNHSMNHPCTGNFSWAREKALEEFSREDMAREIRQASDAIQDLLGLKPRTFAYPCGQKFVGRGRNVKSYVPIVASEFLAGRGWLDEGPNDPVFCDLSQLLGMEMDGLSFEQARLLIEEAASRGSWLVFCGHDVGTSGPQTVLSATLDAVCAYALDPKNGLWVDTVEHVANYIHSQRDH